MSTHTTFCATHALRAMLGVLGIFAGGVHALWASDVSGHMSKTEPVQTGEMSYPELGTIVDDLQATYQRIMTYRADFSQESVSKVLHTTRQSNGYLMFKKPGKMRWIYQKPRAQEVILQPDRIYIYLPKENQVMTKAIGDYLSGITPTRFLMGIGNLKEDFTVSLASQPRNDSDTYHLRLIPKETQNQLRELQMWIQKKTLLIEKLESMDLMDNWTRIVFSSQEVNPELPDSLFFFQVPKDAEILQDSF